MIWGCHTHWKTCFVVVVVVVAMIFPTTEDYKHWKTCFVVGGFLFPETINTGRHIFVVVSYNITLPDFVLAKVVVKND